jgi:uncharacterized protein YtpQ (UPF0354 family)
MKWLFRFVVLLILLAGSIAAADSDPGDILKEIANVAAADPSVASVTIDRRADLVRVTLKSGDALAISPDTISRSLAEIVDPADRRAKIADYMRVVRNAYAPTGQRAPLKADILPVVRNADLDLKGTKGSHVPFMLLSGDLAVFFVADEPDLVRYLNLDTMGRIGLTPEAIKALSLSNLRKRFKSVIEAESRKTGMRAIDANGTYEPSLMLVPELWQALDKSMGAVIVGVPTADVLIIADADVPGQREKLQEIVRDFYGSMEHPVSWQLYKWTGKGTWVVLQ